LTATTASINGDLSATDALFGILNATDASFFGTVDADDAFFGSVSVSGILDATDALFGTVDASNALFGILNATDASFFGARVSGVLDATDAFFGTVDADDALFGTVSKGSGSFRIDHPLKPDTHHLVHSFIEGPQADNLYRGKVQLVAGRATVNLDDAARMTAGTFVALNGNVQCFTTNECGWTHVRGCVDGNVLTIEAQDPACTDEVSWFVIGERHDQHMIDAAWTDENGRVITEPEKVATGERARP
jgi:hypothetical protein